MPIDWIPIELPLKLELPNKGTHIPVREFDVERDNTGALVLAGVAHGSPIPVPLKQPIPGTIASQQDISCQTSEWRTAELRWHGPTSWKETGTSIETLQTTARGKASRVTVEFNEGTPSRATEWLTGVPSGLIWPRFSDREVETVTRRLRNGTVEERRQSGRSSTLDHAEIATELPTLSRLRLGVVSQQGRNDVVRPGFLEFSAGPRGLPDDHLRNSVRRSFEFLFGCGLGVLGWSEMDSDSLLIRAAILSSYTPGGAGPPCPPALLHRQWADGIDEQILTDFVVAYLARERELDLNRLVWLYLHARSAPLDMACGYLGAAFELLRRGYYALPEHAPRSRRLPKDKWTQASQVLMTQLELLANQDAWSPFAPDLTAIGKRIGSLNEISGSQLNTAFLTDLKLRHGEVEKRALLSRNDAAHANPLQPDSNLTMLANYRALHTLLARTMFAVLGLSVEYIDYSALDFPHKSLAQQQAVADRLSG